MRRNVTEMESHQDAPHFNTRNAVLATMTSKNLELSLVPNESSKITHNL